jgi:hypothetical protein
MCVRRREQPLDAHLCEAAMSKASRRWQRHALKQWQEQERQLGQIREVVAVPITADEVMILNSALTEAQRYTIARGGIESRRAGLLKAAGAAIASEHRSVPVPVDDLKFLGTIRQELLDKAPRSMLARQMAELCDQLTVRGGLACQRRWTVHNGPWGLQCDAEPRYPDTRGRCPELEGR